MANEVETGGKKIQYSLEQIMNAGFFGGRGDSKIPKEIETLIKGVNEKSEKELLNLVSGKNNGDTGVRFNRFATLKFLRLLFEIAKKVEDNEEEEKVIKTISSYLEKDDLTKMDSRAFFVIKLTNYLRDKFVGGDSFSVPILTGDIDFFKTYNDGVSHLFGNVALQKTAKCFLDFELAEFVSRFGGEEFVVLLKSNERENIHKLKTNIEAEMTNLFSELEEKGYDVYGKLLDVALKSRKAEVDDEFKNNKKFLYDKYRQHKRKIPFLYRAKMRYTLLLKRYSVFIELMLKQLDDKEKNEFKKDVCKKLSIGGATFGVLEVNCNPNDKILYKYKETVYKTINSNEENKKLFDECFPNFLRKEITYSEFIKKAEEFFNETNIDIVSILFEQMAGHIAQSSILLQEQQKHQKRGEVFVGEKVNLSELDSIGSALEVDRKTKDTFVFSEDQMRFLRNCYQDLRRGLKDKKTILNQIDELLETIERVAEKSDKKLKNTDNVKIILNHGLTDGLTGLFNGLFFEKLKKELKDKDFKKGGIVFLDMNFLKAFNEVGGHILGDIVLLKLADTLSDMDGCLPMRITKGEEFALLFTDGDGEKIKEKVEEIRDKVVKTMMEFFKEFKKEYSVDIEQMIKEWINKYIGVSVPDTVGGFTAAVIPFENIDTNSFGNNNVLGTLLQIADNIVKNAKLRGRRGEVFNFEEFLR